MKESEVIARKARYYAPGSIWMQPKMMYTFTAEQLEAFKRELRKETLSDVDNNRLTNG